MGLFENMAAGLLAGIGRGIVGYGAATKEAEETFNWKKFVSTVIGTGIIGAVATVTPIPQDPVTIGATSAFVHELITKALRYFGVTLI